ncbi:MAG: DNA-directed RNA polymerase subunit alpha [Bacteroidia bacterium]|nr:DNA-directed RNA polymerase subunit alpha [Bacteroidia bacterium]MCF8427794.1 DNA-directed RNA polymerase subunit alpha [Bacteroidia bacterium]MCF8446032.1 DNA-directed RNA polymerase subunit alpha [Bacteroidia bacterium]
MGILAFQKPDKVIMHKDTEFFGQFEFRPLEKGYGVTIGNSLRRILLSSLEGYAITSVKITGVEHEFSTLKGVIEDITEVIMNLKQVRFKRVVDGIDNEKIYINIKGQEQFLAGEIGKHTNSFMVLNPDLVICNMEPFVHLEIELTVDKGRGYVPADENKSKDAAIGVIAMDSVYTPIKNVKFSVEDYRVEQRTDYEKLLIEIETDGSIHPEEALKEAAKILIQHFMLFSDELITLDTQVKEPTQEVDENYLHVRKILKTPLSDLDLSVRAYNCLKAADIKSLAELVSYDIADLLKFRNFGKKSLSELEELVRDKGLTFGIDISKYKLDQD